MKTKVIGTKRYYYEDDAAPEDAHDLPSHLEAVIRRGQAAADAAEGKTPKKAAAEAPADIGEDAGEEAETPAPRRGRRGRRSEGDDE